MYVLKEYCRRCTSTQFKAFLTPKIIIVIQEFVQKFAFAPQKRKKVPSAEVLLQIKQFYTLYLSRRMRKAVEATNIQVKY